MVGDRVRESRSALAILGLAVPWWPPRRRVLLSEPFPAVRGTRTAPALRLSATRSDSPFLDSVRC